MSSRGTLPCSSISRARGNTFSRAKSRAVRWASSCSSVSARSKPVAASVVVAMAVLLVRVDADIAAVGVAREEVVAVELADRPTRGLAARAQGIQERHQQARAGRADRMPERDGAAVHVEPLLGDAELAAHALDAAERLVHLEQVDRADRPSRALQHARDRAARREQEQL